MEKLLNKAKTRLANNSRKGFTLVELIVVIVILAILIAALVPAILGVINQANIAADQADVRAMMMAGSVVGMQIVPPQTPKAGLRMQDGTNLGDPAEAIVNEFTGGINVVDGTYRVFFDGAVAVGGHLDEGRAGEEIWVGITDDLEDDFDSVEVVISGGQWGS